MFRRFKATIRLLIWTTVAIVAVLSHPNLYVIAIRQSLAYIRRDWYRAFPYLPIPDLNYLRFRMETVYGTPDALPASKDLLEYLRWCRTQRSLWV